MKLICCTVFADGSGFGQKFVINFENFYLKMLYDFNLQLLISFRFQIICQNWVIIR